MKKLLLGLVLLGLTIPVVSCNRNTKKTNDSSEETLLSEVSSDLGLTLEGTSLPKYELENVSNANGSAYYEILVGTYADSNGDGIGDFNGIKAKLPYLKSLGVKGLWLLPIFPSSSYHKYDADDYYSVDKSYGTMDDFDSLVAEAKKNNIDIILDLAINHTSTNNPYFIQSAKDYGSGYEGTDSKKDWYVWSDKLLNGYYKNSTAGAYYEANFSSGMPELNFDCQAVRDEIKNIVSFWLNRGIKGFRLDAVTYYYYQNTGKNDEVLSWLSDYCHSIKEDAYLVGEVYTTAMSTLSDYAASGVSVFNFKMSEYMGYATNILTEDAKGLKKKILTYYDYIDEIAETKPYVEDAPFLSNHDMDRSSGYLQGDNAKVAASLYLLGKGHPFIYYGEEIGLRGKRPANSSTDADRRLAMIWSENNDTYRCKDPEGATYNTAADTKDYQVKKGAEDNIDDESSLTYHYKKVLSIRNKYNDIIEKGKFEGIGNDANVLIFKITNGDNSIVCATNLSEEDKIVDLDGKYSLQDEIRVTNKASVVSDDNQLLIGAHNTVILK